MLALLAVNAGAQEPPWDPSAVKPCDRPCLTAIMDRYLAAMIAHDRSGLPLERDVRMTENTAAMDVGEGILWRAKVEPTTFKLYVADPVAGQVGLQTVLNIEGRPALVAIRFEGGTRPDPGNRGASRPQRGAAGHGAAQDAATRAGE